MLVKVARRGGLPGNRGPEVWKHSNGVGISVCRSVSGTAGEEASLRSPFNGIETVSTVLADGPIQDTGWQEQARWLRDPNAYRLPGEALRLACSRASRLCAPAAAIAGRPVGRKYVRK
jgi:hypothetical protein